MHYYCEQNVRRLREGFNTFREQVEKQFNIDVITMHSASSLSYQYIMKNVFMKDPRIYATSGLPDTFIRQAIVGGRCMVRNNDCYHTKMPLVDFDAVSLYPSAMSIMKVPLGCPKAFTGEIPEGVDYYVAKIELKKVCIHRHFPLQYVAVIP